MSTVYVSSTYVDLETHRQAVYRSLRQLRHDVVAMEDYVATDQRPLDKCLDDVARCDMFVLIVAWRYGHIPNQNNPGQLSITELEYRHARLLNKRCLVFLVHPDAPWPRTSMEFGDGLIKLNDFRAQLMNESTVSLFYSVDDLAKQVAVAAAGVMEPKAVGRPFHNLPRPSTTTFVDRATIIEKLHDALSPAAGIAVTNLHGLGGVGKSTLVLHVAHEFVTRHERLPEDERFGAIVWFPVKRQFLNSEGIVAAERPTRPLRNLLAVISITLEREDIVRAPEEHQAEVAIRALRRQRTLLLLDGMEEIDAAAADFLTRLPSSTKVVISSRRRIADADRFITVGALSGPEAVELILVEARKKAATLAQEQVATVARVTGGIPVAILWSVAQIAHGFDVNTIVNRLRSAGNDVAKFCFEGVVDAVRGTPAHRLLLALSLFVADTRKEDVVIVAGLSESPMAADDGFFQLEQLSLISREGRRVSMLPLTRDFVQLELSRDTEHGIYLERWKTRIAEIAAAHRPHYWYDFNAVAVHREAENLRAALDWARKREDWSLFLDVVTVVCWHDNYSGLWAELIQTAEEGVAIASKCGRPRVEAELRAALLGFAYSQRGDFERARRNVERALAIYQDTLADTPAVAFTMCHLAQVHRKSGDLETAEAWYARADALLTTIDDGHRTRIATQFELGKLARDKSEWEAAAASFNEVRRWLDDHPNDPLNQTQLRAAVLGHLALVKFYQQDYASAREDCLESLRLFSALSLRVAFGPLFWRLAIIEHAMGNFAAANDAVNLAIIWFSRLGMNDDLKRARTLEAEIATALAHVRKTDDNRIGA